LQPPAARFSFTGHMAARFHPILFRLVALWLLNLSTFASPGANIENPWSPSVGIIETNATGPTLHLNLGRGESPKNPVAEFMYFVPLISLEPVAIVESPGNTQCARIVAATRSFTARSFLVTCEFEFTGEGHQQNIFDHAAKIHEHEQELKNGGALPHQLGAINIAGAGFVSIQVTGTVTNRVPTVTEVQLRFNSRGRTSPVTIELHDVYYADGTFRIRNENVARVSTLTFHRQAGPAKMEITVTSVKRKDAGDNLWQNFKAGVKGVTANLFIKPVAIDPAGNETMLNFGSALVSAAPEFTFPLAQNRPTGKLENH
jgi:hypothetical protein